MHLQTLQTLEQLFELDAVARFEAIAADAGDRIALSTPLRSLSYRELDQAANQLARGLLDAGADQPCVALLFEHDVDMVIGVLGAMKAGRAYVPLDASYPVERLRYMLSASGQPPLVTMRRLLPLAQQLASRNKVIELEAVLAAAPAPSGDGASAVALPGALARLRARAGGVDAPAYLLYTSGSTGQPKGVMQSHRNLLYHTWVWISKLGITSADRLSLQSAYSWDSSVQDIFGALLSGATLYPVNLKTHGVAETLAWMRAQQVSVYHTTLPIYRQAFKLMQQDGRGWPALRMLAVGGDAVYSSDLALCRQVLPGTCRVAYAYGATESSTILMNLVDPAQALVGHALALGVPAPHAEVYLDPSGGERPGEGEIIVASAFVCDGYHGQARDPAKFGAQRDEQGRLHYRTGDIARRLDDGSYTLLGRRDNMVKIGGMRVDTAEVEGCLSAIAGVEGAALRAVEIDGERMLVAYVVRATHGAQHNASTLLAALALKLPAHALPARFLFLAALPLTPNGKLDRMALPQQLDRRPELAVPFVAGQAGLQSQLAQIWQQVLGLAQVGVQDNFFDLGGRSLTLARVHARIVQELGLNVALTQLYASPTIAGLCTFLQHGQQHHAALAQAQRRAQRRRPQRAHSSTSL